MIVECEACGWANAIREGRGARSWFWRLTAKAQRRFYREPRPGPCARCEREGTRYPLAEGVHVNEHAQPPEGDRTRTRRADLLLARKIANGGGPKVLTGTLTFPMLGELTEMVREYGAAVTQQQAAMVQRLFDLPTPPDTVRGMPIVADPTLPEGEVRMIGTRAIMDEVTADPGQMVRLTNVGDRADWLEPPAFTPEVLQRTRESIEQQSRARYVGRMQIVTDRRAPRTRPLTGIVGDAPARVVLDGGRTAVELRGADFESIHVDEMPWPKKTEGDEP